MRAQGVMLNESTDMDMRSASSSFKTEASSSPSVCKRSYNSSTEQDDDGEPLDCPMPAESDDGATTGTAEIDAPSDEEGGLERKKSVRQKWELKNGMVQVKVSSGNSPSTTDESNDATGSAPTDTDKHPTFEKARLKWDKATAQLTKRRVDQLGAQSWHGKRRLQDNAPVKTRSAPRNTLRTFNATTTEMAGSTHSQPAESCKDNLKGSSPPRQSNGKAETPNGNVGTTEPDADEQSISMPTPAVARNKFAAMSESANLESSTTSFLAELPKMPRRWKIDDDGSVASSVVRGGRVYRIQGPSTTKRFSYSTGPSKWTPRHSTPSSSSIASRTLTTGTSSESSDDDDDITEYNTIVPLKDRDRRGSVERSESGSSVAPSIATYDDFDLHYPLETVPSAGSKTDQQDPVGNTPSVESGQEKSIYAPLNDTESNRKANRQEEEDDDDEEEEEEEEEELGDYEEDLQDVEVIDDYNFVVDKVPAKKRWSSKNIHNFPVWPPIIKVQTWDKKNVSAVSIGSGFSFDESFTNSNAVVSSLGDDDISYEEEEFIRRPPEHRTSYRIRYDGPTSLKLEDIYKTPMVDRDGRFESTKKPADGLPTMPARRVTDSAPSAPPRISASSDMDDISVSLSAAIEDEGSKRPDVWITPVSGALPTEPLWKVRRVWAVEDEDEKEQDHAVGNHELFEKIKSLVGARDGASGNVLDNAPQLPQRSWHVRTVVEKRGRLENVEAEKSLDVVELQENIKVMAEEAVKEIASNQKVFEEYKMKRELQKAEEELMQTLEPVESVEEVEDTTPFIFDAKNESDATSLPVDDAGDVTDVDADHVGETTSSQIADGCEVTSVKADDVAEAASVGATEVDDTTTNDGADEVEKATTYNIEAIGEAASDKATGDVGETIIHEPPNVVGSAAEVDETSSSSAEDAIQLTTATVQADADMIPSPTNDTMDAADEVLTEGKGSMDDKNEPVTDVQLENDDETVVETESAVLPTTSDASEKKTTKRRKKREISPKSSPKSSKDAVGHETGDVPSTPVSTKQKRRSSTTTSSMAIRSPSPATTPKKSKSKTKATDVSSLVSPKRVSKSSKEMLTTANDSPVQNISAESNMDTSKLMTPKISKSKTKLLSPKPKSPKREKSKTDTIRKGRKSTTDKEDKETETPRIKKKVVSLAQLVRSDNDSSDNDSAAESIGVQSARRESRFASKVPAANLTSSVPRKSNRLSLAAMVHDTDSENEESGSDDEQSITASIGPRVVQQATTKSPRRVPAWWTTPGGTSRLSVTLKGTTPISPPLEKAHETRVDSD